VEPLNKTVVCPVLIDRVSELATLYELIDQAENGKGQVILLSGEAGIGKSRLVAEAKAYAAVQGFLLLQGNSFPADLSYPYAPLLDLLRSSAAKQLATTIASELATFARELHQLLPDVVPVPSDQAPPAFSDPEQEKRRLFIALAQFFTGQARKQPMLLIVEDMHWSDDTSLEFLHYLARRCPAYPLLILLTYRRDEVRPSLRHFLAQLDRERLAQEIPLMHLTRKEVEAMLRAIFALPHSAQVELPDLIYVLMEGNPFFVEEILKSLITAGDIFYTDGHWERKPLSELRIPRSVQDAVQQRTDRLSEEARHVLILAAVAGRRFDFVLLQQLTHYDESHLLALMKELIAAQLVVEESEEQFAFRHALTRQAVYADLLVRERKALHRAIAETMERLYAPVLDGHLADLAYHFYEAGAWEKALEYGQHAGQEAQAMYAPRAALEQLTRALDAIHHLRRVAPPKIYLARGQSYETLGEFEQACSDYERALEIARAVHDQRAEWQSLIALGFLWAGRDYTQAGAYYQQGLDLARSMGDPLTLAHNLNRLGSWHLNVERPLEALHYHQEALATFQGMNDQQGLAETLDLLGMAHYLSGDVFQGTAYYQQAVALFQQLDDRQGLVSSLAQLTAACGNDLMGPALLIMSFAESLHYGEQALKIARDIGQRSAEAFTLFNLALVLGPRGEYARALKMVQEGLSIAEQIEHRQWLTYGYFVLGGLYLDLLDLPSAQQYLEQGLALARETGSGYWIRLVSGLLALVSLAQQDVTGAKSILAAAPDPDAPPQTIGQWLVWYARAELAQALGDPGLALEIVDQLSASTRKFSSRHANPRLAKVRGEALAALQRGAEAEAALQAAQEIARAQGLRPLLWRICVSLGKFYQSQARGAEAEQAFSTARAFIEELAANVPDEHLRERFLAQGAAMLPRKRSPASSRTTRQGFGGLTTREREVAALIAQGKSTREIAETLVVSERTVESHVANIMFKLDMHSRSQIAVWAAEKGVASPTT
jgi:DNA-binding CsgD family transcriptional regulator/tetratricopeptide (TPR) repeat protein